MKVPPHEVFLACTTECASFYQGLLYAPVCLLAFVQCFRIYSRAPAVTSQFLFHAFIACFTLIRCVIDELFAFGVVQYGTPVYFVLWALPGLIFFSTYSLLVVEWARVLEEGHNVAASRRGGCCGKCDRRLVLIISNVITYLGQAGVFIMLGFPDTSSQHHEFIQLEPLYLAVVALLSCTAFLVYGCRLYNLFAKKHWSSKMQRRIVSGIFTVTVFCTVCFLIRGVTNIVWTKTVDKLQRCEMVAFYICFYFVVEVLPSLAVLFVMRHMPKRLRHTDRLLNRLPAHLQIAHEPSSRIATSQRSLNGTSSEFESVTRAAVQDPRVRNSSTNRAAHRFDAEPDMIYVGSARVNIGGMATQYNDTMYGFAGSPLHADHSADGFGYQPPHNQW